MIETNRLQLRLVCKEDIKDIYRIYSSSEVCRYYDIDPFESMDDAVRHVNRWLKFYIDKIQIRFVIVLSGRIIGTCGLYLINHNHRRASLGYDLLPEYWGSGYGFEAV